MQSLLALLVALASIIVPFAGRAAAPLCALPAGQPIPSPAVIKAASPATTPTAVTGWGREAPGTSILPGALAAIPFVRHVAGAGAAIADLGMAHGMRAITARSGNQFLIFQVTPDGTAGVSGLLAELTPSQLAAVASGNIVKLPAQHGLDGLFVRSGTQFQVFYVTPDGQRVIPGAMWDDRGADVTRQQVADVPGAIPTVEVGNTGQRAAGATTASAPEQPALPLVQHASFGTVGSATAPHLWMLVDPQCVYSVRAFQMLQPYVQAGRLQLSVIPLAVLDYEDHGQSTRSALGLLSKAPADIVPAWQTAQVGGPVSGDAGIRLRTNMAIADAIHLHGTPTFVWRKADGTEGRIDGVPSSVEALVASIAS